MRKLTPFSDIANVVLNILMTLLVFRVLDCRKTTLQIVDKQIHVIGIVAPRIGPINGGDTFLKHVSFLYTLIDEVRLQLQVIPNTNPKNTIQHTLIAINLILTDLWQ
jgi:hypothetical protein